MRISNYTLARLNFLSPFIPFCLNHIDEEKNDDTIITISITDMSPYSISMALWEIKLYFLCLMDWGDFCINNPENNQVGKLTGPRTKGSARCNFGLKINQFFEVFKLSYLLEYFPWPTQQKRDQLSFVINMTYLSHPKVNAKTWDRFYAACEDINDAFKIWYKAGRKTDIKDCEQLEFQSSDFCEISSDLMNEGKGTMNVEKRGVAIREGKAEEKRKRDAKLHKVLAEIEKLKNEENVTYKTACDFFFKKKAKWLESELNITSARTLQNKLPRRNMPEDESGTAFSNRRRDEIVQGDFLRPLEGEEAKMLKDFVKNKWRAEIKIEALKFLHLPEIQSDKDP